MSVSTHLTRYGDDAAVTRCPSAHMYLFDSSTGALIAVLDDSFAEQIRANPADAAHLDYDGAGHITRTPA